MINSAARRTTSPAGAEAEARHEGSPAVFNEDSGVAIAPIGTYNEKQAKKMNPEQMAEMRR